MTEEEARAVARIACTADGECHVCGKALITELRAAFPEHAATFRQEYERYHSYEDDRGGCLES